MTSCVTVTEEIGESRGRDMGNLQRGRWGGGDKVGYGKGEREEENIWSKNRRKQKDNE